MRSKNFNPDKVFKDAANNTASEELVKQVVDFIWKFDKAVVQDFYIGVTNTPDKRLFEEHKVRRESRKYMVVEAPKEAIAVEAEKALLQLDVNGGLGKASGRYLYCYYIDGCTREANFKS